MEIVERFLRCEYPTAVACLLFGSRAKGIASPESDYDLIVLFEGPILPRRDVVRFERSAFDAFLYDFESCHGSMHTGRALNNFVLIDTVLASKVILDRGGQLARLVAAAAAIRQAGPLHANVLADRLHLANVLKTCTRMPHGPSKIAHLVQMFRTVEEIQLIKCGSGGYSGRDGTARLLEVKDLDWLGFCRSFSEAVAGQSVDFEDRCCAFLSLLGGAPPGRYTSRLPDTLRVPLL